MKIGFTGTRNGMTLHQRVNVAALLKQTGVAEFHHGDCIGADVEAAELAYGARVPVVQHPPLDNTHRANSYYHYEDRPVKSHFARNRDIVNETDILIACPPYGTPIVKETRGGTAFTVQYARKMGKPVVICWPDGTVTKEEGKR